MYYLILFVTCFVFVCFVLSMGDALQFVNDSKVSRKELVVSIALSILFAFGSVCGGTVLVRLYA